MNTQVFEIVLYLMAQDIQKELSHAKPTFPFLVIEFEGGSWAVAPKRTMPHAFIHEKISPSFSLRLGFGPLRLGFGPLA